MANPSNRCPACGPVEPSLSSRYCGWHIQELRALCQACPPEDRSAAVGLGSDGGEPSGFRSPVLAAPPARPGVWALIAE
jgi:hypothetical protein